VTVTVNAAVNLAPVANAGANKTITLPTSSTTLNGSGTDADGTIATYLWQQVTGPSVSTFSATNAAGITVSSLVAGLYTYRLTVTDNDNATATDLVTVRVNNAPANQAPVAMPYKPCDHAADKHGYLKWQWLNRC
jgi:flagellar basal body rod protein FlgC